MKKRIITALILAFILVPTVIIPELLGVLQVVLMMLCVGATLELLFMYDKEKHISWPMKLVTIGLTLTIYFSIVGSFDSCHNTLIYKILETLHLTRALTPLVAIIFSFIVLMSFMIFSHEVEVNDVGKLFTAILYIGLCVSAFTVLRFNGVRFIFYLLLVSLFTDIFALIFGISFGKHKMAPQISPKKTWEGAIGGLVVAAGCGFLFMYFYPYIAQLFGEESHHFFYGVFPFDTFTPLGKVSFVLLLSIAISICSMIGDLVASKLKRYYGIKDYSNIFPGHGGILDRFDSVLFASAIFLLFIIWASEVYGASAITTLTSFIM